MTSVKGMYELDLAKGSSAVAVKITDMLGEEVLVTARVRYGELTTYATVARRAGNERASRAAGGAIGSNPIPIVVPCHRVIASDGTLGGYSGGLEVKRRLLALERGEVPEGGWPSRRGG